MPRGIPKVKEDIMKPVERVESPEGQTMSSYGKNVVVNAGMAYKVAKQPEPKAKLPPYPRSHLIGL